MKLARCLLPVVTLLLCAGCLYNQPLVEEATLPIDPQLVGVWAQYKNAADAKPAEGDDANIVTIIKWNANEYLVRMHIADENQDSYFRMYPVEYAGVKCLQIQAIAGVKNNTIELPQGSDDPAFQVIRLPIKDGVMRLAMLNHKLVPFTMTTTAAIQEAFKKNKDNPDLFQSDEKNGPVYKRIGNSVD